MDHTDVIIVGAGPIGLELAVALKQLGVDYRQFEAGQIAQTITWYPRQAQFFSSPERIAIGGVPLHTPDQQKATREDYLAYLRSVVDHFDLKVEAYTAVTHIEPDGDGYRVTTKSGDDIETWTCNKLVLAIGDMHFPRYLHIPGEDLPHVSHYFRDPHDYFKQRLLIVGGKNSAVEAAIRCYRVGADITISYRRETFDERSVKYWLLPELKSLINSGKIKFHPQTVPARIDRKTVRLKPTADAPADARPLDVDADFVLLLTGYQQDSSLFETIGIKLEGENRAPHHDPDTMETNVPNVFVIGTAAAGTQETFSMFIETSHVHVERVVRKLTGKSLEDAGFNAFRLPGARPAES